MSQKGPASAEGKKTGEKQPRKRIGKRSWVWKYFTSTKDEKDTICNLCDRKMPHTSGNTSGMINHLFIKHGLTEAIHDSNEEAARRVSEQINESNSEEASSSEDDMEIYSNNTKRPKLVESKKYFPVYNLNKVYISFILMKYVFRIECKE